MGFSMSQPVPGNSELRINQSAGPGGTRIYLFRVLSATGPQDVRRFAGVTFSRSYVTSALLKSVTRASNPAGAGTKPVFAVFEGGRQILAAAGWSGRAESRTSLAPWLPLWEIAGAYSGRTVADIAHDQFRRDLLISLLAFAALGVAAFATFTMATRESRLARMKSAFISNVSHEMKTPLALISMYAETLESGKISAPDKTRDYYRTILRESRKLAHMVDNVLDFARLEAGRAQSRLERIDVGDLATEVVRNCEERLGLGGFKLTLEIEPELPPIVGDRSALSQALLNLLDNAVKYSADTKEIGIAAWREDGSVVVEITDKGIGIDPSEQQRIFEQFYRAGDPLTQKVRGAGLGLALVRRIVAAHRGRVELRSTPGKGSAFSVVLPARAPGVNPS
jgi:signal transduction histidine kinase